ncbi:MAG: protein-L-isoaspartate O-methyltransferase [Alphaproteobacteria bacterium]|nr:MAG: protein-L-isoaspartate O-methyltransferase [Alphaproteobacteria bacterium]
MTDPKERGVLSQVAERGIATERILEALRAVDRRLFVPAELEAAAYEDVTLTLPGGVVMPRLFVTATWLEALAPEAGDRILLVGADSGYLLTVLARLGAEVYAVTGDDGYARLAESVIEASGGTRVHVRVGAPEEGWPDAAPFDKILVTHEFRAMPESLIAQLREGGRALMPIGPDWSHIYLERVEKNGDGSFRTEYLGARNLIAHPRFLPRIEPETTPESDIIAAVAAEARPFDGIDGFDIDAFLDRVGDARVVLLGEASHGTSEFYRMRAAITRALVERKGFSIVGFEADWPDMERVNAYVTGASEVPPAIPFRRFPRWMWRNGEFLEFVEWARARNAERAKSVSLYGLDLYGMENAVAHVLDFLERRDPALAAMAREHYSCISPYLREPADYGKLVLSERIESCEREITEMLLELLREREMLNHTDAYFHAVRNASAIVDAERYYKVMYYGSADSWNLRDMHMFGALQSLLAFHGGHAKAVVWAHNSHVGNAVATEMFARGEINIGHLAREAFGPRAYAVGFGTHTGTVAAADDWGGPMRVKTVRPSLPGSYERLCHETGISAFTLPLREGLASEGLRAALSEPKLERAIGVIYRPDTERQSHYFQSALPSQFDELIWFDETKAVEALDAEAGLPALEPAHPFATVDE